MPEVSRPRWPLAASFAAMMRGHHARGEPSSVALGCFLRGHDEGGEAGEGLCESEEGMSEQLGGSVPPLHVHLETPVEEVLEDGRQLHLVLDVRLAVGGDQVEGLNGAHAAHTQHRGHTEDTQRTHRVHTEDTQSTHSTEDTPLTYSTEDTQRTHRGHTEYTQSTHSTEDTPLTYSTEDTQRTHRGHTAQRTHRSHTAQRTHRGHTEDTQRTHSTDRSHTAQCRHQHRPQTGQTSWFGGRPRLLSTWATGHSRLIKLPMSFETSKVACTVIIIEIRELYSMWNHHQCLCTLLPMISHLTFTCRVSSPTILISYNFFN